MNVYFRIIGTIVLLIVATLFTFLIYRIAKAYHEKDTAEVKFIIFASLFCDVFVGSAFGIVFFELATLVE